MSYTTGALILGSGTTSPEAIQAWLEHRGRAAAPRYGKNGQYTPIPTTLGRDIVDLCNRSGWPQVNHDLVAAQIDEETAGWQSEYARERNNPGGIGAEDDNPDEAYHFKTPRDGIEAHVAHLLTYAAGPGWWNDLDPRFSFTPPAWRGTTKTIAQLAGRWATQPKYGEYIRDRANALVDFANNGTWEPPMKRVPEPPFIRTHTSPNKDGYTQPRRIRAIVDHISGGSLASNLSWLTNPQSGASSTVLIAKNGDIYLLVPPSSSPWTNGPIRNPNRAKAIIREWQDNKINPNTQVLTIEHEGHDTDILTPAQIKSSAWVHAWWAQEYGIPLNRDYVLGHYEIDSVERSYCPSFSDAEWNAIIDGAKRLLEGGSQPPPADDWPNLPPGSTVPDPRKDNPKGKYWMPKQFAVYMAGLPLEVTGWVIEPARGWVNKDGELLVIQHTERQRYELHRDGSLTLGLLGSEAVEREA